LVQTAANQPQGQGQAAHKLAKLIGQRRFQGHIQPGVDQVGGVFIGQGGEFNP
jgi:hypothetical protein